MRAVGKKKQTSAALPKNIGGVKLSKGLRRSLTGLLQLADSPMGRQAVAAALAAATATLMKDKGREGGGGKRGDAKPASRPRDLGTWLGEAAAAAITIAARQLQPESERPDEGEAKPDAPRKGSRPSLSDERPQNPLHG